MTSDISIKKYLGIFALTYSVSAIALTAISFWLDLSNNTGTSIAILLVAAMVTSGIFVKDNKRVPSKSERNRLLWGSFGASWLISIILTLIVLALFTNKTEQAALLELMLGLGWIIIGLVVLFVSVLHWFILFLVYKLTAKRQLAALEKKAKSS